MSDATSSGRGWRVAAFLLFLLGMMFAIQAGMKAYYITQFGEAPGRRWGLVQAGLVLAAIPIAGGLACRFLGTRHKRTAP